LSRPVAELKLRRHWYTRASTIGALTLDAGDAGFCLEPSQRHPEHPCIPAGRYAVTFYHSPKFGRTVLLLHDVPGRDFIEIHTGNFPHETEGCLLVGLERGQDWVAHSRSALDAVLTKLADAPAIAITVVDDPWATIS
jgi:Family of unknown function (DUF5675)